MTTSLESRQRSSSGSKHKPARRARPRFERGSENQGLSMLSNAFVKDMVYLLNQRNSSGRNPLRESLWKAIRRPCRAGRAGEELGDQGLTDPFLGRRV